MMEFLLSSTIIKFSVKHLKVLELPKEQQFYHVYIACNKHLAQFHAKSNTSQFLNKFYAYSNDESITIFIQQEECFRVDS